MDDKLPAKTVKFMSLENLYVYGIWYMYIASVCVVRDATIHNLDVSIYCQLCITIQRYIARYNQV